jgi:hypothetical protein
MLAILVHLIYFIRIQNDLIVDLLIVLHPEQNIQSELKLQTIFGTVPSIFSCSSVKRLMQTSMFVHRHFVFLITTSDPLTLGYFKRFLLLFNRCGPISCDCLPYHVSVVTHFGDFFLKFYANVMMLLKSVIPNLDGHYVVQ